MEQTRNGKATLYYMGGMGMGYNKLELKDYEIEIKPYAQYQDAVHIKYIEPRKRKWYKSVFSGCDSFLLLDGHDHPEPGESFVVEKDTDAVTVSRSKYSCFATEWTTDFQDQMNKYFFDNEINIIATAGLNLQWKERV